MVVAMELCNYLFAACLYYIVIKYYYSFIFTHHTLVVNPSQLIISHHLPFPFTNRGTFELQIQGVATWRYNNKKLVIWKALKVTLRRGFVIFSSPLPGGNDPIWCQFDQYFSSWGWWCLFFQPLNLMFLSIYIVIYFLPDSFHRSTLRS